KVSDCFRNYDLLFNNDVYGTGTKMMIPESNMYQSNGIYKCLIIRELNDEINKKLNDEKLFDLYKMEIELSRVLSYMEKSGLYVDVAELHKVGKDLETEQEKYQKLVYSLSGEEFNINSVKQLGEILFEKLSIPSGKKNKSGFSTGAPVLNKLAEKYEIVKYVLQYRKFSKLINTYVNGMEMLIDKDHYIHPLYRQALTVTGRLSSIEPNIQNMPIRSEEGQIIRDIFRSRFENGQIMSIDYSQIELRVLAHMSDDKAMIESFATGEDFHRATAAMMFSVPLDDVTSNMRRTAKAINFGIIYGMGAWSLSKSIDVTPSAAQEYIDKYFSLHSGIDKYLKGCIKDAKVNGYTKTLYNRVRYIPELSSSNKNIISFGERTAMNSPIQGTAADILKMAMVDVFNKMKKANMKSLIIAQVHDELVFDCAPGEQKALEKLAQDAMEHIVELKVPLLAKVSVGESWLKA
ncbi:MAG: DNA polymerase, partial [Bacilli bacterium]